MEQIEGSVENIIFQSEDNGFTVFRIKTSSLGMVTTVYKGQPPFLGEHIEADGMWVEHARFGKQFSINAYKTVQPTSVDGIERFLASGAVKGIGKSTAIRIVEHFGVNTLTILSEEPYRLAEISGIGKKKAETIGNAYAELADMRELMLFLETNNISSNYAPRIQAKYGANALTIIKNNPYILIQDIDGIGFKIADKIALSIGFEKESLERLKAGLVYALVQIASFGHTCIPEEMLINDTAKLLNVDTTLVLDSFNILVENDLLRITNFGSTRLVYPEYLYKAEVGVARMLLALKDLAQSLGKVDTDKIICDWETESEIALADAQKEAILASLKHGIFALTGGPGTGKTTVVKGIITVLERAGCKVSLAAPTGRAARRLAEATERKTQTVHRLLEYDPKGFFGKNQDEKLEADAVIIDEASMLDITLANGLLAAIKPGCRLIFVGDIDQLPSVGAGSVLKDIIRSQKMPVVRLNEVFRQAQISPIIVNAHKINHGEMPVCNFETDFAMAVYSNEYEASSYITELYEKNALADGWDSVQVLSPMHKGVCGVQNLNKLLQARMNPPHITKGEVNVINGVLRLGDKVMQIRNNYDKDVYNGDIGIIVDIYGKEIKVAFPDRLDSAPVPYNEVDIDELQLAYAMSVHKSQGSEYKMVILALVPSHYIMLQRNLIYTAITRARDKVVLVGTKTALQTAVDNDKTRKRYSLLAERLQENGEIY